MIPAFQIKDGPAGIFSQTLSTGITRYGIVNIPSSTGIVPRLLPRVISILKIMYASTQDTVGLIIKGRIPAVDIFASSRIRLRPQTFT